MRGLQAGGGAALHLTGQRQRLGQPEQRDSGVASGLRRAGHRELRVPDGVVEGQRVAGRLVGTQGPRQDGQRFSFAGPGGASALKACLGRLNNLQQLADLGRTGEPHPQFFEDGTELLHEGVVVLH